MITRVQNKRRSSYSYANDVMTPSRRRMVADEEEMIVKNNNNPSTPVRVTTSAAAAASASNDEMKEPAAITTSSSSNNNDNNFGPTTPGRMMAELSKRIRSFHQSTSRNEDSRDDTNNNNSNNSEDYEIHYQYSTDPLDIQQRSNNDSSDDDDDTKSKGENNFTAISTTVSNKKNNFNNNKTNNSSRSNTHHRQRYFIEDEIKRFELFRTVIQHEDDLLNQRVSWIILAQSFLMAAVFTSEKGDFGEESNGLKYITAGLGITTIIITMPSILAAGRNIELQQRVYFRGISSEVRCYELHGHGRDHHKIQDGELEKRYRYGHVFPNMAFRGRGALPILNVVLMLAVAQICGWVLFLLAIIYGW